MGHHLVWTHSDRQLLIPCLQRTCSWSPLNPHHWNLRLLQAPPTCRSTPRHPVQQRHQGWADPQVERRWWGDRNLWRGRGGEERTKESKSKGNQVRVKPWLGWGGVAETCGGANGEVCGKCGDRARQRGWSEGGFRDCGEVLRTDWLILMEFNSLDDSLSGGRLFKHRNS